MLTWDRLARSFAGAVIRGPDDAAHVVRAVFGNASCRCHVVLALDDDHRLLRAALGAPATSRNAPSASRCVNVARTWAARGVVAATLRVGEPVAPSAYDLKRFRALAHACAVEDVALLDWLVLVNHHWWSMRERSAGSAHPK